MPSERGLLVVFILLDQVGVFLIGLILPGLALTAPLAIFLLPRHRR